MSSKNTYKKEKSVKQFVSGQTYRIVNYELDKSYNMQILSRNGNWVTILIDDNIIEARVYPVANPLSESILLDNYSPVFSYQSIQEQDYE